MILTTEKKPKTLKDHIVSISSLNLLNYSPVKYKQHILNPEKVESAAFRKGGMLDCLLTEPDEFTNRYAVSKIDPPGGMMGEFIKTYLHCMSQGKTYTEDECKHAAYQDSGFKIKYEAVLKKFEAEDIQKYVVFVQMNKDRELVSSEEYASAINMYNMLTEDEHTREYLWTPKDPNLESYDQLKIEWKIKIFNSENPFDENDEDKDKEYTCISILDKVLVDHGSKTIYPIDIKSTGKSVYGFEHSYIKFGYFRQAAFYMDAIKYWAKENGLEEYTIENFRFIVVETHTTNKPIIFKVSDNDLDIGKNGSESIKGFLCLLNQLNFHQENNIWDTTPDIYKNNGELELNILRKE
jgi:hypothetical protein